MHNRLPAARMGAIVAGGLMALSASAANASLIGDTVTFEWVQSSGPTVFGPSSAVVGAGVEFTALDQIDVDLDADSILVSLHFAFSSGSVGVDYIFTDLDWIGGGTIGDAVLTVLDGPSGNFSISHTADSITVSNTEFNSSVGPGGYFRVDIIHDVPEPATLALFGLGLAGLGFARRRKTT